MTRWPLRIGGPSTRIHSRRRPYPRTRSKAVPKDLPILPPIVGVAPYRLSRAVLAEQAKLSRQLKEVLASLPAAIDLRRMKDIEAERALIKHHEREAANHHQAAREAQARLAFLIGPDNSVGVAGVAPDAPKSQAVEPSLEDHPPTETQAEAIVRVAKALYPGGTGAVMHKLAFAAIDDALAAEAITAGKPPPKILRDRVSRALGWRKG
jgi:hypothetical protein